MLITKIPLQDGLLCASAELNASNLPANPVWNGKVRIPLGAADGFAVHLNGLFPGLDDLFASGLISADVSGSSTSAVAVLSVTAGNCESAGLSLNLSNLNTVCTVRLPGELRSQPAQVLTADALAVGNLRIENILMHYQLEPDSVFFIEDMEFSWCRGLISLYGARISPEAEDISVHLFCDRLSLEQVLAACGLTGFSAGGELNGKLPLQWTKEGLRIDRGFLFTTPGMGGTFRFGSAKAAAGILPPGSLEEGQIGLVTAALAEFNYDWITMTLNTEGENLRVEIETSGQPAGILPFEYDDRSGTYIRINPGSGRGIRQPMRFKLNLTIPLDQLLCYASGMNRQWNLFKTQM